MLCVLILSKNGATYSLMSTLNDNILLNPRDFARSQEWCDLQFNVDSKRQYFIESQRFCQKPTERKSPKKYFFIFHFTIPTGLWCKKYLHHFLIILHYLCTLTIEDLKWNTTLMSKQMLRRLLSFLDHVRRGIIHTRLTRVLQPALHNGQNLFFSPTSLYRVSCRL